MNGRDASAGDMSRPDDSGDSNAGLPDDLPALQQASLDPDEADALFRDLAHLCRLEWVRARPSPGYERTPPPNTVTGAQAALLAGTVRAVQICYRHGAETWLDTITTSPHGFQLVRMPRPRLPE